MTMVIYIKLQIWLFYIQANLVAQVCKYIKHYENKAGNLNTSNRDRLNQLQFNWNIGYKQEKRLCKLRGTTFSKRKGTPHLKKARRNTILIMLHSETLIHHFKENVFSDFSWGCRISNSKGIVSLAMTSLTYSLFSLVSCLLLPFSPSSSVDLSMLINNLEPKTA